MIGVIDSGPAASLGTKKLPVPYPDERSMGVRTRAGRGIRRIAVFLYELLTNVG